MNSAELDDLCSESSYSSDIESRAESAGICRRAIGQNITEGSPCVAERVMRLMAAAGQIAMAVARRGCLCAGGMAAMPEAPGPAGLLVGRRPAISALIVNKLSEVPAGTGRHR